MKPFQSYIKEIFRMKIEELNKIMVDDKDNAYIFTEPATERIDIVGLAQLEESSKVENRSLIFTDKLTAILCGDYDLSHEKHAFILVDVDGNRYILGQAFHPFCIETVSRTMPDNPGDKSAQQLEVSYTGLHRLKRVIE